MSSESGGTDSDGTGTDDREPVDPDSLDKYVPDVADVLGTENERKRAGKRVTDAFHTDLPNHRLDFAPSSTAIDEEDSKYDEDNDDGIEKASHAQTGFDPSEWGEDGYHFWETHMRATNEDEENRRELDREQERSEDIAILEDKFDLSDHERWFIEVVNDKTDLRNHGSPRYEALLLAALRVVFRGGREATVRPETPNSFQPDYGDYPAIYEELRGAWSVERGAVTRLTDYVTDEYLDIL